MSGFNMCRKYKFYVIPLVLLLLYFQCKTLLKPNSSKTLRSTVNLQYVVVHLDLKGSPPKLTYLESLLPTLKKYGVNGILMEYEDMFPYEGRLVNLSATTCFNRQKLKKFVIKAINSGVEIIPLVQTFGHMEHALKLKEFMHLREVVAAPTDICPSKPESQLFLRDMLKQVIDFHSSILPLKHIHVGCDEVYKINHCKLCRQRKLKNIDLFLKHVQIVEKTVKGLNPDIKVLIWDDMLLKAEEPLQKTDLDLSNIEPVCWNYRPDFHVSDASLYNYHKVFNNIWVASAFKGADGDNGILPNLVKRFLNNLQWLRLISDYKFGGESKAYNFKGMILTGWSRYSHMAPLCELLPAAMPSLILNLILIKTVREGIDFDDLQNMDFCDFYNKYIKADFEKEFESKDNYTECSFENNRLYIELNTYFVFQTMMKKLNKLEFDKYNFEMGNINLKEARRSLLNCDKILKQYSLSKKQIENYMSQYYENDVIEEYLHDNIGIYETDVRKRKKFFQSYSNTSFWRRRPYHIGT